MNTQLNSQKGEIATILTIASLIVVATGALLGNRLTQNQALNSQAARCVAGELSGPRSGKDCSGATGRKINCGYRVIADTFNVEEVNRGGKAFLRIEGNFCYTGDLTSGANKGQLYITTEHPGKPACYKVLAISPHGSFFPGTMPLCDQTGQWAKLNPKLPIPDRFRGPDKTNYFSFLVEKPVDGCVYLNAVTQGQQGGGGAGDNFDIWNDPRLCSKVTPVPSTLTPPPPTITCGGPSCPPTPTTPLNVKCNDICTGAGQCADGNICFQASSSEMRCRNPRNLTDEKCQEITPPPTGATPPPTTVITPTGVTPLPTNVEALKCNDVCDLSAGKLCPADLNCVEVSGSMRCRRLPNIYDDKCLLTSPSPTITGYPTTVQPTITGIQGCIFNPINFVMIRDSSGGLTPLRSPDPTIWGSVNDKVRSELNNNDTAIDWNDFDSNAEYYPCKNQPGGVCNITSSTCCGKGASQYNIVGGDVANVLLKYDTSKYKVVQQCYNNSLDKTKDLASCANVNDEPLFKNLPVKCGEQFRYGWILEEKDNTDGGSCPLMTNDCKPGDVSADIKNNSTNRATIDWDYPASCNAFKAGVDRFWIDIVDENNKIVCSKSVIADESDTRTECKLGRDKERQIDRDITKWEDDVDYHATVYTVETADVSCRIGASSPNFSKPGDDDGDGDNPDERRSHQLDVWESGSQGDDCYIAADTATGTNQKQADHCRTSRNPTANGLDELQAKYANRTGKTLQMNWQINSCNGKLLSELGGVCNDFVTRSWETISLPNGKMLVCTWTNPKENPNVSCEIKDIDFSGGNNNGGGGNPPPTNPPSQKGKISGQIVVDTTATSKIIRVLVECSNCEGGLKRIDATNDPSRPSNVWTYEVTDVLVNHDYSLRATVHYEDPNQNGTPPFTSYSDNGFYSGVKASKDSKKDFTVDITRTPSTTENINVSGHVGINNSSGNRINHVLLQYKAVASGITGSIDANYVSNNDFDFSKQLPKLASNDSYLIRAIAYVDEMDVNFYDPECTSDVDSKCYKKVSGQKDSILAFNISIRAGVNPTSATTGQNKAFMTFNVKNASDKNINDLVPVICNDSFNFKEYNDSFRIFGITKSPNCRALPRLAKVIGKTTDTSKYPNQTLTLKTAATDGPDGYLLKDGQKVKIGCQYLYNSTANQVARICPLVDATTNNVNNQAIQNITVNFGGTSNLVSSRSGSCDVNDDGACNSLDYIQVSQHLGQKGASLVWDLNGDRVVNGLDASIVLNNL